MPRTSAPAAIAAFSRLLDRLFPEPDLRQDAQRRLEKLSSDDTIDTVISEIAHVFVSPSQTLVTLARPAFLYVMYAIILWASTLR